MMDWSERGNIWKRGRLWDPSARTQLFAADRLQRGSKKEETLTDVPDGSARGNKKKRMLPHRPT